MKQYRSVASGDVANYDHFLSLCHFVTVTVHHRENRNAAREFEGLRSESAERESKFISETRDLGRPRRTFLIEVILPVLKVVFHRL